MTEGGSIVTMSYYGAEKVVSNYNVMGVAKAALEASTRYLAADLGKNNIRVNAISAGPINTLSARGVKNMGSLLELCRRKIASETQRSGERGRQHRTFPGERYVVRHHRRNDLRRLRIQHHGHLVMPRTMYPRLIQYG